MSLDQPAKQSEAARAKGCRQGEKRVGGMRSIFNWGGAYSSGGCQCESVANFGYPNFVRTPEGAF